MAIFKCKMCGGDLDVVDGMSVAECEYCGTKQTLPKLNDNEKEIMYEETTSLIRQWGFMRKSLT